MLVQSLHAALQLPNDRRVNGCEVRTDTECSPVIARRQLAASDLSMVMGLSKAVTGLERLDPAPPH